MDEATDNFITWKKTYRLRHSISNRYLCVGAELTKRPSHNGKGGSSDGLKYYTAEMVDSENLAGSKSEFIIKNTEETWKKDFPSITDCTFRLESTSDDIYLHYLRSPDTEMDLMPSGGAAAAAVESFDASKAPVVSGPCVVFRT